MANSEHLKILKTGVEAWNAWRDVHCDEKPNLRAANLRTVDLQGAHFARANLQKADLREANLQGANFLDADLRGAKLQDADLRGAGLQEADLLDANLQHADLRSANLQGADLQGANLQNARLHFAKLQNADLHGANLQRAKLWDTNLRGADLQGANLLGAILQGANLQGAKLQHAELQRANLQGAKFQGAKLQGAELQRADLEHADLSGADLSEAHLEDAKALFCKAHQTRFSKAHLRGAQFWQADLQGALFESCDLSRADFQLADLRGANFLGATLTGVNFTGAKLKDASFNSPADLYGLAVPLAPRQASQVVFRDNTLVIAEEPFIDLPQRAINTRRNLLIGSVFCIARFIGVSIDGNHAVMGAPLLGLTSPIIDVGLFVITFYFQVFFGLLGWDTMQRWKLRLVGTPLAPCRCAAVPERDKKDAPPADASATARTEAFLAAPGNEGPKRAEPATTTPQRLKPTENNTVYQTLAQKLDSIIAGLEAQQVQEFTPELQECIQDLRAQHPLLAYFGKRFWDHQRMVVRRFCAEYQFPLFLGIAALLLHAYNIWNLYGSD